MMEPQTKTKVSAKDFFINLGAIVALYTIVYSLVNLLFTIINTAYPQIMNGYNYTGSSSISWPVATLVIFFPIFILLMWLMGKEYLVEPERQTQGIHRWLTYITLFISGLAIAGDLITVLYYFIDGQELTTGFLLKILVLFIIATSVFLYYISDVRGKLTPKSRMVWRIVSGVIILGSIIWGFTVLGSPRTQRLYKYDEQKVMDLQTLSSLVENYYQIQKTLPNSIEDSQKVMNSSYYQVATDPQTHQPYEYEKTGKTTYNLCAEFNKASPEATSPNIYARPIGYQSWIHPAGHFCFNQTINPNFFGEKPIPSSITPL